LLTDLVADANGLYANQTWGGSSTYPPGVYSVSTSTGALTLVQLDPTAGAHNLALDTNNVYWLGSGGTLQAKAR